MAKSGKRRIDEPAGPPRWHPLILICLSVAVFANTFGGEFVWDDEIQILRNPRLRTLASIPEFFTSAFWDFAVVGEARTNYYRPVQAVTYAVAFALSGTDTWAFHLLSILFHVIAVLAVWRIVRELGYSSRASLLAASLFAVHPVHTEAVAWIASIPDLSAGAFYFLSAWLYLRFDRAQQPVYLWGSALLFLAALFSKEMAATLPVVLLLLVCLRQRTIALPGRKLLLSLVPYGLMAAVYGGLRLAALSGFAASHNLQASWLDWFSLGIQVVGRYVRYALVPYPLTAYHLIPVSLEDRIWPTAAGALVLAAAIGIAWRYRARLPELRVLLGAFLVTLTPVLYFKGIGGAFFSERYLYIPTLAAAVLAAVLIDRSKWRFRYVAATVLVAVFALSTIARNPVWRDAETLYRATLENNPLNAHFQSSLGEIELRRGEDERARARFATALRAIEADLYYFSDYEEYRALVGLGALAARRKDYEEARGYLERSLEAHPEGDWAYLYLGGVLMEADNDYTGAMEHFRKAIELGPINEVARDYMGIALLNQGRYEESVRYFREALRINPAYEDGKRHLDLALQAMDRR